MKVAHLPKRVQSIFVVDKLPLIKLKVAFGGVRGVVCPEVTGEWVKHSVRPSLVHRQKNNIISSDVEGWNIDIVLGADIIQKVIT